MRPILAGANVQSSSRWFAHASSVERILQALLGVVVGLLIRSRAKHRCQEPVQAVLAEHGLLQVLRDVVVHLVIIEHFESNTI